MLIESQELLDYLNQKKTALENELPVGSGKLGESLRARINLIRDIKKAIEKGDFNKKGEKG
jgi:hypothetical protein